MKPSNTTLATSNFASETKALLALAIPMSAGAVIDSLVPFINVFMLAKLGTGYLSGFSFGDQFICHPGDCFLGNFFL
jgi:Na+-driven multidrug efflux pump